MRVNRCFTRKRWRKDWLSLALCLSLIPGGPAFGSAGDLDGDGKISAYGSVIDNRTTDPTYVPSQ